MKTALVDKFKSTTAGPKLMTMALPHVPSIADRMMSSFASDFRNQTNQERVDGITVMRKENASILY